MIRFQRFGTSSNNVETQIAAMGNDKAKVDDKATEYRDLTANLLEKKDAQAENKRLKYAIPNLLTHIMDTIPKNVQLTSITNSREQNKEMMTINAQSDRYDQLGIFITKITQDGILANVVSNESTKENGVVKVTIKGELP